MQFLCAIYDHHNILRRTHDEETYVYAYIRIRVSDIRYPISGTTQLSCAGSIIGRVDLLGPVYGGLLLISILLQLIV